MANYNVLLNFINNRITMLCEVYIKERAKKGMGILMVSPSPSDNNNVNVAYISLEEMNDDMLLDINTRMSRNSSDIIYFYVCTIEQSSMIELDIRDHTSTQTQ